MITEEQFRMGRVRHEYEPGNEISTPMFDSAPKCRTCGERSRRWSTKASWPTPASKSRGGRFGE
jgi:hypothetical protein